MLFLTLDNISSFWQHPSKLISLIIQKQHGIFQDWAVINEVAANIYVGLSVDTHFNIFGE